MISPTNITNQEQYIEEKMTMSKIPCNQSWQRLHKYKLAKLDVTNSPKSKKKKTI